MQPTLPNFNFGEAPALPTASTGGHAHVHGDDCDDCDGDILPETAETAALHKNQEEYDEIVSRLNAAQREVIKQYEPMFLEVTNKRRDIVNALVSVPPLETARVVELDADALAPKGIEDFWLTCMRNSSLSQIIEEHDEELLQSITDITSSVITGERPGFDVTFHFKSNAYFTQSELKLTCIVPDFPAGDDVEEVIVTPILWKNKKNITRSKNGKEERQSFFHVFDELNLDELEEGDEEYDRAMGTREMAATTCFILREKVIPNAVNWYTGVAAAEEEEDEDEEYYGEEGEDEEEDDEDGAPAAEGEKPECKQQ